MIFTLNDIPEITPMTSYDCRKERGNCQICWTTSVDTDIDVSGKPNDDCKHISILSSLITQNF